MASQVNILGLSGSLRRDSYNSALLRTANELLPEGAALE
ncbi:MAG: NAD(P)H-dependent oxidoreductase, partial [Chloroflexi bacterium]|nr:NAD(P)H-dependent oxidoreductase [Chloroflexota bacterium]